MGEEMFAGMGKCFFIPKEALKIEPKEVDFDAKVCELPDSAEAGDISAEVVLHEPKREHCLTFTAQIDKFPDIEQVIAGDGVFDIVMKDEQGNEFKRVIQEVKATPIVHGRIPRKMKKRLKRCYGVMWKWHHPNADFDVVMTGGKD